MKYIFLDFDGVLNSDKYFSSFKYKKEAEGLKDEEVMLIAHWLHLDPEALEFMNQLVDQSKATVVVSSTWRVKYSIDELNEMLASRGATFKISDKTPRLLPKKMSMHVYRGEEIQAYLDALKEPAEGFVIIDDVSDMLHLRKHLVHTDFQKGFRHNHIKWALRILDEKVE